MRKPLAGSVAECRRAVDACQQARVRLQVGFMRRYDPAYAGSGDPMWDLATMVLWDPAMLNPVLKGYDAGLKLTLRAIGTIRPYVILRHLAGIGWQMENGFDPSAGLNALRRYQL